MLPRKDETGRETQETFLNTIGQRDCHRPDSGLPNFSGYWWLSRVWTTKGKLFVTRLRNTYPGTQLSYPKTQDRAAAPQMQCSLTSVVRPSDQLPYWEQPSKLARYLLLSRLESVLFMATSGPDLTAVNAVYPVFG